MEWGASECRAAGPGVLEWSPSGLPNPCGARARSPGGRRRQSAPRLTRPPTHPRGRRKSRCRAPSSCRGGRCRIEQRCQPLDGRGYVRAGGIRCPDRADDGHPRARRGVREIVIAVPPAPEGSPRARRRRHGRHSEGRRQAIACAGYATEAVARVKDRRTVDAGSPPRRPRLARLPDRFRAGRARLSCARMRRRIGSSGTIARPARPGGARELLDDEARVDPAVDRAVTAAFRRRARRGRHCGAGRDRPGRTRREAIDHSQSPRAGALVCDRAGTSKFTDAGTIFVAPEREGIGHSDRLNHVLTTGGAARFRGCRTAADFVRVFTVRRDRARPARDRAVGVRARKRVSRSTRRLSVRVRCAEESARRGKHSGAAAAAAAKPRRLSAGHTSCLINAPIPAGRLGCNQREHRGARPACSRRCARRARDTEFYPDKSHHGAVAQWLASRPLGPAPHGPEKSHRSWRSAPARGTRARGAPKPWRRRPGNPTACYIVEPHRMYQPAPTQAGRRRAHGAQTELHFADEIMAAITRQARRVSHPIQQPERTARFRCAVDTTPRRAGCDRARDEAYAEGSGAR